jgi:acyl-CoA thioesterase FadM
MRKEGRGLSVALQDLDGVNMYPIFRFAKEMVKFRSAPRLDLGDIHVSTHMCWPWDVDPWMELNNGRALTLFDLGRLPMAHRSGLVPLLKKRGWKMAVAGMSVRYRRRVRMFQRVSMQSTILGWDNRFFYFQQSMWSKGEATSSILARMAVTDDKGIMSPAKAAIELGWPETSPDLPEYVSAWIVAEAKRPWPPLI